MAAQESVKAPTPPGSERLPRGYMTDIEYLREAYRVAEQSPDPSTQNGAVLVDCFTGDIMLGACNDFPAGVVHSVERLNDRDVKLAFIEHAERAVIFKALRVGLPPPMNTYTLYACWAACADCSRAIIASGIKEVVAHKHPTHDARPEWRKTIDFAKEMFKESGVNFREVEGKIGGVSIRFNKVVIEP